MIFGFAKVIVSSKIKKLLPVFSPFVDTAGHQLAVILSVSYVELIYDSCSIKAVTAAAQVSECVIFVIHGQPVGLCYRGYISISASRMRVQPSDTVPFPSLLTSMFPIDFCCNAPPVPSRPVVPACVTHGRLS